MPNGFSLSYTFGRAYLQSNGGRPVQFVGGSALSDAELWELSFMLVDTHGMDAVLVAYRQAWAADGAGDLVERAKWSNVLLGVTQLLGRKQKDS